MKTLRSCHTCKSALQAFSTPVILFNKVSTSHTQWRSNTSRASSRSSHIVVCFQDRTHKNVTCEVVKQHSSQFLATMAGAWACPKAGSMAVSAVVFGCVIGLVSQANAQSVQGDVALDFCPNAKWQVRQQTTATFVWHMLKDLGKVNSDHCHSMQLQLQEPGTCMLWCISVKLLRGAINFLSNRFRTCAC